MASVDSVVDCGGWNYLLQSKGNFFYFAATANSTMDNSTTTKDDGVVNSPPNCNTQPMTINSLLLLRAKLTTLVQILGLIR